MTSLDWILLAWAAGLAGIGIVYQGAKREVRHAYHRGYRQGRRDVPPDVEAAYADGYDDGAHDFPAPPVLTLDPPAVVMAKALAPAFDAMLAEPPEWDSPAAVPATVMAELEPATVDQPAVQAGELTLEFMRYRDEAEAEFRSIRQRAIAAISGSKP